MANEHINNEEGPDWLPHHNLCIRHNNEVLTFAFYSASETPAVVIRHDGQNWYNKLVEPTTENAGAVHIWHNGKEYALST